ncbi:hypothetical protein L1D14_10385 [Vibrio tubiashii]|uniref:hypothetical protein n=1 Tax=Vibrio tubiashii TaxID=29498 RepID=UPI001EFD9872|nr:hypothetical protein [Vibrio tubiashii]MCG9576644.1 hypothetical protein [Vibrio tubiashii]
MSKISRVASTLLVIGALTPLASNAASIRLPSLTLDPENTEAQQLDREKISEWEREQWSMTKDEWDRYMFYKSTINPTSVFLDMRTADPYTVLFHFAETEQERISLSRRAMKYAREQTVLGREWLVMNTIVGSDMDAERGVKSGTVKMAPDRLNAIGSIQFEPMTANKLSRSALFYMQDECDSNCKANVVDSIANTKVDQQVEVFISSRTGRVTKQDAVDFLNEYGITKDKLQKKMFRVHIDKGEAKSIGVSHYPTLVILDYVGNVSASRL